MKMFRKLVALSLVFVLVVGMVPAVLAAPETTVDTGDVTIEDSNGFGDLQTQEITKNQQKSEADHKDYPGGYAITDLEIVDNVATVTYDAADQAVLMVALYTEDGMQCITSATVNVTSKVKEATVTFEGEMPEYFLASACLLDQYNDSPLCASYNTSRYTQEMQKLLASTVGTMIPKKF